MNIIDLLEQIDVIIKEDLKKGSLQQKHPFKPTSKENLPTSQAVEKWSQTSEPVDKYSIPPMNDNAKKRALNKLSGLTEVRKHPQTGERLFLMHRGMSDEEFNQNHHKGKTTYHNLETNSWTPNYNVANDFGFEGGNQTVSAWIPESSLHNSLNQYNIKGQNPTLKDEHEWLITHKNPHHHANMEALGSTIHSKINQRYGDISTDKSKLKGKSLDTSKESLPKKFTNIKNIRNQSKLIKGDVIDFKTRKQISPDEAQQKDTTFNMPEVHQAYHDPKWKQLHQRFQNTDFGNKLAQYHEKLHDEPYKLGCVHDVQWGNHSIEHKRNGDWNRPFPLPVRTDPEKVNGILGKNVHEGGTDPFAYLDRKYRTSHQTLVDHATLPLEIHTRSDLIAMDNYLKHLNPKYHKVNIHFFSDNDQINKMLEPGAPSFKRRLKAVKKLREAGIPVKMIHNKITNLDPELNSYDKKSIFKALGDLSNLETSTTTMKKGPQKNIQKRLGINAIIKKSEDLKKNVGKGLGKLAAAASLAYGTYEMKSPEPNRQPVSLQSPQEIERQYSPQKGMDRNFKNDFMNAIQLAGDPHKKFGTKSVDYNPYHLPSFVIKETVKNDNFLKNKYNDIMDKSPSELYNHIKHNHPQLHNQIADKYYNRLYHQFGNNEANLAHAWAYGIKNTKKKLEQSPNLQNHWHVSKVLNHLKNFKKND